MTISVVTKSCLLGLGLWMSAVPILRLYCKNLQSKSLNSLSSTCCLWLAGIGVSYATVKALPLLGIQKGETLTAMAAGTVTANLIDGVVFSYFPSFYGDAEATVRAAGHVLWTTSWGIVIALLGK